ncbi:HAMP domain-containing histidine kinase [Clostridium botulinum]|uniref:HAMP domain-containing sensor histidine kinase n=1 Tax=Clostridium botulinum TaxID=1491 RepID=UPI000773B2B0|nr:HAMP domain-containing sensor histidine kinase [Clostridium botulinum]NFH80531.1 HAMP domain-containing histidine kinase [Clostridium botulinum]NFH83500.1 HAMP domain-containing histidine kinase [Clostridium botulinum]NFI11577.1 HAMP domain-containing histidine kinase [Clostridium botulinum]NFI15566.1 HAMP domain-containing histidine kinase [Clostridium botulinum]NFO84412.1 HAMP domain-containing histidine kinase [Clostridium botulinum]
MKQSLLKRLILIISLILFISFIIGQIFGFFIIKEWFLKEQLKQLVPVMENISHETRINNGTIIIKNEGKLIIKAYNLNNDEIPINDNNIKKYIYFSDEEIKEDLLPYINIVLKGEKVATIESLNHIKGRSIIIGIPIIDEGNIVGTIFAVKLASDFSVVLNGFYFVFFITSFISTIIIIALIYYFTRKIIKPLIEMVDVSNSMASGNFSARAKCDGYGEIKILSNSLNNLALRLFENDKSARLLEQTRRDYIANVSHELRTPISSIRAISEILCDDIKLDEDKKKKYYLIVLRESKRLQKLINDMLELSRLQSGEMAILKEVVSGRKIMSEIEEYFEVFSEDMDEEFIITEKALNIPNFYSNENRIRQVLFILIDNGFKFTKQYGYVKLDALWDEEMIKISVENNGNQIEKEDVEFIFERFYKGDKSHNKPGSGLGLSLAKEIMRNLDEEIYVAKNEEGVTRFEFTVHRNKI